MKRIFAFLLSILLVCSMATPAVYAAYENSNSLLTTDKTQLTRGETFTVTAKLENNEALRLCTVALSFDESVFEMVGGKCLASDTMMGKIVVEQRAGTFIMDTASIVNGDIFAFKMKVKEDALFGTHSIGQKASVGVDNGNYIAVTGIDLEIVCDHRNAAYEDTGAGHHGICPDCGYETTADHSYDQQVITDAYKATAANFSQAAGYYYSCVCGAKGNKTFADGEPLVREGTYSELCVDKTQLTRGETFTVTAKLTNTDAIKLGTVMLIFDDSIFELVGGKCLVPDTMMGKIVVPNKAGTFLLDAATAVSGDIFTFAFKVKENAPFGVAILEQKTAIGVETGSYITAAGINLEVVCTHSYDKWNNDGARHSAVCGICGEKAVEDHTFGDWMDNGADHKAVCDICSAETVAAHTFSKEIAEEDYLANEATCTAKAAYYYSCECGAKGEETFEYGETLPHSFTCQVAEDAYFVSAATCTAKAVYYYSCQCGEKGTETFEYGETLPHSFTCQVAEEAYFVSAATCTAKAVYYYSCQCGEKGEETFSWGDYLPHDYQDKVCTGCGATIGDLDGNEDVTTEDVVQLLLFITMPELFPVGAATVDFDGDAQATTEDAVKLLLYISMPDLFPL